MKEKCIIHVVSQKRSVSQERGHKITGSTVQGKSTYKSLEVTIFGKNCDKSIHTNEFLWYRIYDLYLFWGKRNSLFLFVMSLSSTITITIRESLIGIIEANDMTNKNVAFEQGTEYHI